MLIYHNYVLPYFFFNVLTSGIVIWYDKILIHWGRWHHMASRVLVIIGTVDALALNQLFLKMQKPPDLYGLMSDLTNLSGSMAVFEFLQTHFIRLTWYLMESCFASYTSSDYKHNFASLNTFDWKQVTIATADPHALVWHTDISCRNVDNTIERHIATPRPNWCVVVILRLRSRSKGRPNELTHRPL